MIKTTQNAENVAMLKEKFTGILDAMGARYTVTLEYHERQTGIGYAIGTCHFEGHINGVSYHGKDMCFNGSMGYTEWDYISKIAAYLFDVLDGVANL